MLYATICAIISCAAADARTPFTGRPARSPACATTRQNALRLHALASLGQERELAPSAWTLRQHPLERRHFVDFEWMHARARALGAPPVDGAELEIDIAPAQPHELGRAQTVPVGDEDHRVVARAVAAFPGGAKKGGDFVAGEVGAEARCGSHGTRLPQTTSSSRAGAKSACCRLDSVRAACTTGSELRDIFIDACRGHIPPFDLKGYK